MPQLDKVTFLPQYFWLCFFYLGFYYTLVKYFLPKISRILAIRKTKLQSSHQGIQHVQDENTQRQADAQHIGSQGFSVSKTLFDRFFPETTSWVHSTIKSSNTTKYQSLNSSYLHGLGETPLCQNIRYYHATNSDAIPSKLAAQIFLDFTKMLKASAKK